MFIFCLPVFAFITLPAFDSLKVALPFMVGGIILIVPLAFAIPFVNKSLFWYLVVNVVPMFYACFLGSFINFVGCLHQILPNSIPLWVLFSSSSMLFLVYFSFCFSEYFKDYFITEKEPLKGIDTEKGEININEMRISNANVMDTILKHRIWRPFQLFVLIVYPLGYGGIGLLTGRLQTHWRIGILGFAMFYLVLIWSLIAIKGFFMLYVVTRLQIKHRKWFKMVGIEEP
jgi:type III secretory pathway component EscS